MEEGAGACVGEGLKRCAEGTARSETRAPAGEAVRWGWAAVSWGTGGRCAPQPNPKHSCSSVNLVWVLCLLRYSSSNVSLSRRLAAMISWMSDMGGRGLLASHGVWNGVCVDS